MEFITNEKLTIVGAAGMIGSNMAQTAAMMHLTPNICLYDAYAPGLEGVVEEMRHCGFEGVNITFTTDVKEAFTDAKYIISSGGSPRKQCMTREDLLKGNAGVAEQLGKDIKAYCPDVRHVVIIFNPADITGLSCPEGEVDNSVFDRYIVPLYKQASYKPYIIAAMMFLAQVKAPVRALMEMDKSVFARKMF